MLIIIRKYFYFFLYLLIIGFMHTNIFANEEVNIWHISSAKTDNSLFSISSSIAASMSLPFNTRNPCNKNHCGVRSLVALAHTRSGIIGLLREITLGQTDSAIFPLDIVYAAYNGQMRTLARYPYTSLRLLAPVTSLPIHIITLKSSGIKTIHDGIGKTIAFVPGADETERTHLNRILNAYEIDSETINYKFMAPQQAKEALINGEIQILMMTGQDPIAEIRDLDRENKIRILSLEYAKIQKIIKFWPHYYTSRHIAAASYKNQTRDVLTLSASYVWVTHKDAPEDLVHDMVRALWHPETKRILRTLNENATMPENLQDKLLSLKGLKYHDGALRYYRESNIVQ